jgi:Ca-activated chloride channel homolog
LSITPSESNSTQVAQRWAGLRMAELEAGFGDTRAELRELGRRYGLVSRETSLIVLEALDDYVLFEIEPPPSLREAYERAMAQGMQRQQVSRAQHLDSVAARFAEQVAWWEKDFPKDGAGLRAQKREQEDARQRAGAVARQEMSAPPRDEALRLAPAAPAPMLAERRESAMADGAARKAKAGAPGQGAAPAAVIRLQPWQPDLPYARRLRQAAPEVVYQAYLDERPQHLNSTAFFLDAADVLFAKQQPLLAMRVLSNLAEMELENRHILRVLGYRLLQARAPQLALPVLREVQRLSPHEPQSFRDLGLAHAEAGQWQDAADQLWQVVSRPWDGRFPDIDLTALAELNMVIARAGREGRPVNTAGYDRRLLRLLPLDLRIVLGWDADNTDIDLWVTDPDGEQVYYGRRLSHQGGRVSRDVTGGYGPEEFALKAAKPGRYLVQARFYGHRQQVVSPATTLMLVLSTGFGRAHQKDERVTLRLSGPAEMVTVGSFVVGVG